MAVLRRLPGPRGLRSRLRRHFRDTVGSVKRSLLVLGLVLALAAPAQAAPRPGAAGIGDPYFPKDGNGGYDVAALRPGHRYPPDDARADGRRDDHGAAHAGPVAVQPRPRRPDGAVGHASTARAATWRRNAGELTIDPRRGPAAGPDVPPWSRYDGVPRLSVESSLGAGGFMPHRRRRAGRGPAARRLDLVPGQRPPDRQGRPTRSGSACRAACRWSPTGSLKRRQHRGGSTTWTLGGGQADGVVPRHGRRSGSSTLHAPPQARHQLLGRHRRRPLPARRHAADRLAARRSASRPTPPTSG